MSTCVGEEEEMAGSGEHPPGEIEGKQSRNPERMEAPGDPERPPERKLAESKLDPVTERFRGCGWCSGN